MLISLTPSAIFSLSLGLALNHHGHVQIANGAGAVAATATTSFAATAMLAFVVEAAEQREDQGTAALAELHARRALPIVHANCVG